MLTSYRRAYQIPGARRFSLTGLVARLPIAMIGLGIVLLVSNTTGSYALAGALSACFQISAAMGAILTSRWADRLGQDRLLPWLGITHGLALSAFAIAVVNGVPLPLQVFLAAVAGVAQPAIGSMVRARWAHAADPRHLRSAFAVESIIDELIFSIGPLITALLAIQFALPLPLLVASVIAAVGSVALGLQRGTQPPPHGTADLSHGKGGALTQPGMPLLFSVALGIGGVFGTYEVTVVAFTASSGRPEAAGWVLALWAFGSMLAGLAFGAVRVRMSLPRQVVIMTMVLTLVLVPAPFVASVGAVGVLGATTFVAGAGVAPALIATFSLTERLVPSSLLTEGLTWTNSGLALGFSGGSWLAGAVVDSAGTTTAFVLPIVSAATAALLALGGQRTLIRACRPAEPMVVGVPLNVDPVPGPAPGGVVDNAD